MEYVFKSDKVKPNSSLVGDRVQAAWLLKLFLRGVDTRQHVKLFVSFCSIVLTVEFTLVEL